MERNTRSPLCLMLEAVLFASGEPVPVSRLAQACEVSESAVQTALQQLAAWYEKQKSAICVQQLGDSWQMCTHPAYATVIQRAVETKKAAPLSAAAMEVLTIVAYNQPVSKSFVEHVRGVDSSSVVNTLVEKELQFFIDHEVPQVKFVDRTFNCNHEHAMAIWRYIKEHDNGITNFHFEIAADILNEEELELVNSLRPGAIQMEIGVQSTNLQTIEEIDRVMDVDKLAKIVARIHQGHNVHVHLDLIAGLPYEDYESFAHSFNDVYAMKPEQLQLGFLKVLKGSKMYDNAERYGLQYTSCPPYEVLFTKWISYDEILRLKQIEEMVEIYYNSCQFENTLPFLVEEFDSPFDFYASLASYYDEKGYFIQTPARIYRYHVLLHFAEEHFPKKTELIREMLVFDLYLRENMKTRPDFAPEQEGVRDLFRDFYIREANDHRYLREEDYHGCDWKSMSRMTHIEKIYYNRETGNRLSEVCYILFDYKRRDPLTGDARYMIVTPVASM